MTQHAKNIVKKASDYYFKQFNNERDDLYHVRQMAEASQIFDPIFLNDIDATTIVTKLHYLADKLRYFGYSH